MQSNDMKQCGFSLVEIMVAMVIALLGTIVVFQVFSVSEGIKRTTTSGGDAQQFGSLALFSIERDLRMAGYGINNPAMMGCTVRAYDTTATPQDLPNFPLLPIQITVGADDTVPDQIALMYGDSALVSASAKINQNMLNPEAVFNVNNRFGFRLSNLVLAFEPGKDCTLAEVTDLPGGGNSNNVVHNSGNYLNEDLVSVPARYNKPAGLGVSYTTNGLLFNLGDAPMRKIYRIVNNQLVADTMLATNTSAALADNIVHLKAQYGRDDGIDNGTIDKAVYSAGDGNVDGYTATMPALATATDWARVLSIRVGIVARSALPERPSVDGGPCDTTTAAPTWAGGTFDLSTDPDWQCYRYRVFETTVTLRNLLWQQI